MLTEATIGKVKYFPEQLPDSVVTTIGAGAEASPIILDLRQFPPLLVRLAVRAGSGIEVFSLTYWLEADARASDRRTVQRHGTGNWCQRKLLAAAATGRQDQQQ